MRSFTMTTISLNADQEAALALVKEGKNIFLTGPAGAGKSTLIQAIVTWAAQERKRVDVTALTGCAALLLGQKAKTLHSWAGIGLAKGTVESLVATVQKMAYAKRRWKSAKILVIDEISMMTPDLFEKLDALGKALRNNTQPWGGIQLVLCGDFFQLPPVSKGWDAKGRFAFDTPAWAAAQLQPVLLSKIERQTDAAFQTLLNEARIGTLSDTSIAILKSRKGLPWKDLTIKPTLLFSRNADVDAINEANLAALGKPLRVYEARTRVDKKDEEGIEYEDIPTGELLGTLVTKMDTDSSYCTRLELCEGCQVMLLYNKDIEGGLVNGSRGVVIGFRKEDGAPIVQFLRGEPVCIEAHEWKNNDVPALKRLRIPLRVAYAVTIHKSQGATLDCALVDIGSSTFECGQAYVALSRVRSLESLYIHNLDVSKIRADPHVVEFYESLSKKETPRSIELQEEPFYPIHPVSPQISNSSSISEEMPFGPPTSPASVISELGDFLPGAEKAHESWWPLLEDWALSEAGKTTLAKVAEARTQMTVFPKMEDVFAALQMPVSAVRVVVLGQDPYHEPDQAMGLAFSVRDGVKMPPSLKNIRKELRADLGEDVWSSDVGDLTPWVYQGVLLLNTVLTVEEGKAASHAKKMGWETLTQQILKAVLAANPDVIFLAWGKFAQAVCKDLGVRPERMLEAPHPSPLSASKGFFGSRPFSKANALLATPIVWNL